jgi:uncharacterized protein
MNTKRACLIHGLGGTPSEGWIPWLKGQLEDRGYTVYAPQMPTPFMPDMKAWQETIAKLVGSVDSQTYFVGHSLGCLAILYYLESLPIEQRAGGVVFVSGALALPNVPAEKIAQIVRPWFDRQKDFEKIREQADKMVAILSDDDPLIPVWQLDAFAMRLGAETVLEHGKGHYTWLEGIREAPTVLEHLLRIAKERFKKVRSTIETKH